MNLSCALVDDCLAGGRGGEVAIREPKRVWTYARLDDEAARAGAALRELGIKPGEPVALVMHDSAELAATFIGALRVGAVPVPLNVLLRPLELRTLLIDCRAVVVIAAGDLAGGVESVRNETPSLRHLCAIGGAGAGQIDFGALTRDVDPDGKTHMPADGAPAFMLYSGGAQSNCRGVTLDHAAARHAFANYARHVLEIGTGDRVLSTAKLSTAYGLGMGLLFPLMAGAATFLLPGRARPRTLFDVLTAFNPTLFAATPSLYAQLCHDYAAISHPRPTLMGSVRHAISGGESLPIAVEKRVRELFKLDLLHGFGVTDALGFVLSNRRASRRESSVGTPLPGVEARIVDEGGNQVRPQEIGALELHAPCLSQPLRTGDRFLVDADGYYYYCGRADDLFKVSGRWVQPDEIERALLMHPAVWECAVVEGADDDGLPLPVAYIVPNVGHTPSEDLARQLMGFVKDEIAPYKYPRRVSFVEALPRGSDGNVQRWKLRAGA